MLRAIICICTALVIAAFAMPRASADARGRYHRNRASPPPALKDCTRLNGRWGYYGNPWCCPAEQLRWDRWDGRRAGR